MRIVKEGAEQHTHPTTDGTEYPHYDIADTIEITDAELIAIIANFVVEHGRMERPNVYTIEHWAFPQYLRDLISLTGEGR